MIWYQDPSAYPTAAKVYMVQSARPIVSISEAFLDEYVELPFQISVKVVP